jgi:PadR family transcriptional regulator PadR
LTSKQERDGKSSRRIYRTTAKGKKALDAATEKVRELFGELFEDD